MKIVEVTFPNSTKLYSYYTNLSLVPGMKYDIEADNITRYSSPVKVVGYRKSKPDCALRTITSATLLTKCRYPAIKKVHYNLDKRATVVRWEDGVVTSVKCGPGDMFDLEKGIMACYVKRLFGNCGRFNTAIQRAIEDSEIS